VARFAFNPAVPVAQLLYLDQVGLSESQRQVIWGSDYPHLSIADKVGSVQLFNLLADWAPDEATRRRILVDNPAALFGFSR
jgi:predicted TIM-barrel fold metal-dependent hydrolase